jgi:hypothetical protein
MADGIDGTGDYEYRYEYKSELAEEQFESIREDKKEVLELEREDRKEALEQEREDRKEQQSEDRLLKRLLEEKRMATDILVSGLQNTAFGLKNGPVDRAENIAEAYRIVLEAVRAAD